MHDAGRASKPDLPVRLQAPLLQQQRPHQEMEPLNMIVKLQGRCAGLARETHAVVPPSGRNRA